MMRGMNVGRLGSVSRYYGGGGRFAGSSLQLDFTKTQTLDPRITFSRASTATRINASGALESVAINGPRFDYDPATLAPMGLLIEEQRTNSIRNNTMQGAVAGTPGTLPTNWLIAGSGTGTLSQQVVGTGIENGINYIDVRVSGTTSTTGFSYAFEPSIGGPAATAGQTWTSSVHLAIVGGNLNNIQFIRAVVMTGRTSTGAGSGDGGNSGDQKSVLTPAMQRFSSTVALISATTVSVQPNLALGVASGAAIDITLRIGMPQLELGAFATSVIPTTTAAATRAADVAVMTGANFSNWYRQDEGTLFAEAEGALSTSTFFVVGVTDGSTEVAFIRNFSNTARFAAQGIASASAGAISPGQFYKAAFAFTSGDQGMSVNGGNALSGTTTITTAPTLMRIGQNSSGTSTITTHYKRIAFFPRRLSNAELQGITS